jgi:hypothetical protein
MLIERVVVFKVFLIILHVGIDFCRFTIITFPIAVDMNQAALLDLEDALTAVSAVFVVGVGDADVGVAVGYVAIGIRLYVLINIEIDA